MERALIECYNFSLYDSRRRSVISTGLLLLIQIVWNLLPNVFFRQTGTTINTCNGPLTRQGKILLTLFFYKEVIPLVLCLVATVLVLRQLARHRHILIDRKLNFTDYFRICLNHKDFFAPLILYCFTVPPTFIYFTIDPYYELLPSRQTNYPSLIIESIYHFYTTSTFVIYVYANRVYREAFWGSSFIGRGLIHLWSLVYKKK